MKQIAIGAAVVVVLVAAWFALDAATKVPEAPRRGAQAVAASESAASAVASRTTDGVAAGETAPAIDRALTRVAAPTTGGLALRVIWAADATPAPGIDVSVSLHDGTRAKVTRRSDAAGRLQFDGLEQGIYSLQVPNTRNVSPPDVTIVAGQVHACDLVLDGDVRLRVLVVDGEGTPRAGAAVWCEDPYLESDPPVRCLGHTDAAGLLAYRGLPVHSVWARLPPLQPSACADLPQLQQRELPREPVDVRLVLGPSGCIVAGTVVDPDGRPVASASVLVASDEETDPAARHIALQLTTDAGGRFSCDEVAAGERAIVADATGFAPAVARIVASPTEPVTTTLVLRIGATLSGRVTDAAGQPVAGVIVVTSRRPRVPGFQWPWGDQRLVRTDAEGHYRIEAILPGSTRASVQMKPGAVRQFQFDDGQKVTWDVAREPDRCLVGVVTDADGKPLVGWRVEALGGGRVGFVREQQSVRTDAAGRFRIAGLEDSTYRLFVFAPVPPGQDAYSVAATVPRAVVNNVRPSPTELAVRIDAAAMASGWIEGSIAMPEGVRASTRLSLYAKVLQGGKFDMPQELLEPGVTTFRLGPLPPGEYDLYCEIEGRGRLLHSGLRLAAGATLQLPPFAAKDQRPLQIVLRHADGRPATGASVVGLARCRETAPGRYESQPIAAGDYDVKVHGPDFAPMAFRVDFATGAPPFERVVPTGTTVQLCIKPPTPRDRWVASLSILLRDGNGTEVLGERIEVDSLQDFVWPIGLVPGSYTAKVNTAGDGTATATFQVGGQPLRIDLPLAK